LKSVQAVRANPTTIPYNRILRHTGFTLPDISRSLRAGRQVQRRLERLAFDLNVGVPTLWYRAYYPSKNISTLLLRSSVDSAMLALRRTTKPRLNPYQAAPQAMKGVAALDAYVQSTGLEPSLLELIKMRAAQINGCAYCLHVHARDARAKGESEERLYLLDAWRESPLYTDPERCWPGPKR